MSLFRVRIELRAPLGTPLTSGTLFGHLCWAKRETRGEAALVDWLASLSDSPWAVSDGFPAGLLPRPLLRRRPPRAPARMTREALDALEQGKLRSKRPWVTDNDWRALRTAASDAAASEVADRVDRDTLPSLHRTAHNSIDRRTGSTPEEGGLFFVDELWCRDAVSPQDVYVRADTSATVLRDLFAAVGEAGYGRDATWGRGHFTVSDVSEIGWLDDHAGNRRMSLSHGCITANMAAPRYKLFTHFGKVGAGLLAEGVSPWKYPILLARPGCTFSPADEGPFGAWLTQVHQERPEIGHNAFHLAIPYTEADEGAAA